MHTVDLLEHAVRLARGLGFTVREEWLGGSGGGGCEIKGRKWLFLDLALGPADQLQQVLDALRRDVGAPQLRMPPELRVLLNAPAATAP